MTDQMFRDMVVCTARPTRKKTVKRHNTVFTLKHAREEMIFGTRKLRRSRSNVLVSDPHRTTIDMLDDPSLDRNIVHAAECFDAYLRENSSITLTVSATARYSKDSDFSPSGNRSPEISCRRRNFVSPKGHAKLDPAFECEWLITRWRLRVPESWKDGLP